MAPAHVPAWRRLGLKLKSEESTTTNAKELKSVISEPNSKKRKLRDTDNAVEEDTSNGLRFRQAAKRAKKDTNKDRDRPNDEHTTINGSNKPAVKKIKPTSPFSDSSTLVPNPPRRKSVTFSPDTKTNDGSSYTILTEQTSTSRLARKSGLDKEDIEAASRELNSPNSPSLTPAKRKKKKAKTQSTEDSISPIRDSSAVTSTKPISKINKPVAASSSFSTTATTSEPKYLNYLDQYHTSRNTWKFNKNCQNALLKNLYDLTKIPPHYNDAVRVYVVGLRGDAIRQKLHDEAKETINGEEETGSENGEDDKGEDEKLAKERMEKLQRAKMVKEGLEESWARFQPAKKPEEEEAVVLENEKAEEQQRKRKEQGPSEKEDGEKEAAVAGRAEVKLGRQTKRKRLWRSRWSKESESSSSSSDGGSDSDSEEIGNRVSMEKGLTPNGSGRPSVNGTSRAKKGSHEGSGDSGSNSDASATD